MDNKLFYEQRPYIYIVIAALAFIFARGSKIGMLSGWILLVCAALTLFLRHANRKRAEEALKKHNHLSEKIIKEKEKNRI